MQSLKQLINFFLMVSLLSLNSGCGTIEVADIGPFVTLPASQDCYQKTVITHKSYRIGKATCDEMKKRAIFITSEDWQKQRFSIQKNCQLAQCKQLVGAFDDLFLSIDSALKKTPQK